MTTFIFVLFDFLLVIHTVITLYK